MSNKKRRAPKQARKGIEYFGGVKLSRKEVRFRKWLEHEQMVPYNWFRTLPEYRRMEYRRAWYAELLERGVDPATGKKRKEQLNAKTTIEQAANCSEEQLEET